MDEITFWIYTKRAPCLMKYDMANKQKQPVLPPKASSIIHTISDETTTPKSKKRKHSIFEDELETGNVQANMFFNTSNQKLKQPTLISGKSDSVEEADFNIKKSSITQKVKRMKLQKNGHTVLHKKSRLISSTPKQPQGMRRSKRSQRKSFNDATQINNSLEVTNVNGNIEVNKSASKTTEFEKSPDKHKQNLKIVIRNNTNKIDCNNEKTKITVNGQYDHMSDVSGFTASYIRSTKDAPKNGIAVKRKNSKDLFRGPQWNLQKEQNKLIMSINKVAVTCPANPLTSGVDSSSNCLNLAAADRSKINNVTPQKSSEFRNIQNPEAKSPKDNFMDSSPPSPEKRYPSRNRTSTKDEFPIFNFDSTLNTTLSSTPRRSKRRGINNHIPTDKDSPILTRSRSGKLGSTPEKPDVLVINNSTEETSTDAAINVSSLKNKRNIKNCKSKSPKKSPKLKRSLKHKTSAIKNTTREKSGFSACFSDSDDDKPLKPLKFFC